MERFNWHAFAELFWFLRSLKTSATACLASSAAPFGVPRSAEIAFALPDPEFSVVGNQVPGIEAQLPAPLLIFCET